MVLKTAKEVLKIEANAISKLIKRLDESFIKAVDILFYCRGRVVVTGIGKSGWIGNKIAATFASTGTPAFFLHPAEGGHGDIGMVMKNDVMLAISNSGETREINDLLPPIKRLGIKLISMTGNLKSLLAKESDVTLDVRVDKEACPLGLAPTASTTAALAMGDALAISLLKKRGFKKEDYAFFHPGGQLGKKLLLKVDHLMHRGEELPLIHSNDSMKEALLEITSKKLGVTTVVNGKGKLCGIITDGDLRRALEKHQDLLLKKAGEIMTTNPKIIKASSLAVEALQVMEKYSITSLVILDKKNMPEGVIHLHDILKTGIV
ncbi:MAG: D-arabinose 5-phosphate isomerase [Candidatus Schekmanbacteria bacterium GWA2_38_11]|uniref:D-arabinose 5-phosphate isomerase n=2 Tax=Candidatus Schekmaniibacteriota TaxID=1817811 RepID=A0A1F7RPA1_9BACT|nr:MAG: D-arabinose 5-phosphate isomerase [Candidatus Schekmanbacteria bacterium GWA2_38_11]